MIFARLVAIGLVTLLSGAAAAQNLASPSYKAITLPGGTITGIMGSGSPTDGAVTQQVLTGLSVIGSRAAEPNSNGQWYFQSQCSTVSYIAFYAGSSIVTNPATARLLTIVADPGAGQGRQGGDTSWATTFGAFQGPITAWGAAGCQSTLGRQ